ncbi:MAG: hypothetical protein MRECE_18c013 [Mycoplasmataceae bacterium CE_OT135]|nr:MAG: hypothetical protein MRECE_29c013 [Mycoplasmataceae bacterium CE_OT135]KLL03366.1 MAG: hypothetical protein MRECE_18c013 [Mycoplasmataceae bacterium CE_OT135]
MIDKQLVLCGFCPNEFMLDLNNNPTRYIAKKKGKKVWVCPECRKILVDEG